MRTRRSICSERHLSTSAVPLLGKFYEPIMNTAHTDEEYDVGPLAARQYAVYTSSILRLSPGEATFIRTSPRKRMH